MTTVHGKTTIGGSGRDGRHGGIHNDESISLGKQWNSGSGLVVAGIPCNGASRAIDRLVDSQGVQVLVSSTRGQNVESSRGDGQRSHVPGEGDIIADFVV